MIEFESKGSFKNTEDFLRRMSSGSDISSILEGYGREGVAALASATPVDSGLTAESWSYEVTHNHRGYDLVFRNTNVVAGTPVAILIQYGHGTGTGGYVQGRDFINPAVQPLFDRIANDVWKVVTK